MGGSEQCWEGEWVGVSSVERVSGWEQVGGSDCAGSAVANCRKREVDTKKV